MKRSEVNKYINDAMDFMAKNNFHLPEWAYWNPLKWEENRQNCSEIFNNGLGWDITDFGSGEFLKTGLTLFTMRNGNLDNMTKLYCEKIMYVRETQFTPLHFHFLKTEDIINRAGGILCMKLWQSSPTEDLDSIDIKVKIDGIDHTFKAGETIKLKVGQSICYTPHLYHTFWSEEGDSLIGEVSSVNNDHIDNRFLVDKGRFSKIEEDVPAQYYLCNEYKK